MLSAALPTDMFWDSALGRFVPAEATIQLANCKPSIARLMQANPSIVEDFIRYFEQYGCDVPRRHPEILLQAYGLDPSKFDLDALRNRRVIPSPDGLLAVQRELIKEVEDRGPPPPIDVSQFTPADWAAIRRLQQLGNFPESRAIQGYMMAHKNETWAAEFLLEYSRMSNPGQ
jgi:hypothetical protein